MKKIIEPKRDCWTGLCKRTVGTKADIDDPVRSILETVKRGGDRALIELTSKFDRAAIKELAVPEAALREAAALVPDDLKQAIKVARENIERFHRAQKTDPIALETMPGVYCSARRVPIPRVGLYIPGGSAPLFSTLLMLAVPALIAGCREIILCSPPQKDGEVNPEIRYIAAELGLTRVFRVGGAQAIAAMAYGTDSVPRVDKIFGPGNQFVTKAKEMAALEGVAIDMPAGPSEVLVIADESANPAWVAADLLAQAEHGADSGVCLVATNERLIDKVIAEIERQVMLLSRESAARAAVAQGVAVCFSDLDQAMAFSNEYAPEHLILAVREPRLLGEKVESAGSVFLGNYTPEVVGDYGSGTNHVLPTNALSRAYSGVGLETFQKRITFQELTPAGLALLAPAVCRLAEAEGLDAHKKAALMRMEEATCRT